MTGLTRRAGPAIGLAVIAWTGAPATASLEAYVDGVVESAMERDRLPGVTLAVVKDGDVSLLKGYGLASIEPRRAVDPERSLFRVGSISKTLVWTSMMQLVESGRLSLDDPVNDHLPPELQVPDQGFDEPIRIRHLMAHAPGFEDSALGHLFVRDESRLLALDAYLRRFRPRRVREPGTFTTYSNYGAALAGLIVARLSVSDFESHVERAVFEPLGMERSTFREPFGDGAPAGLPAPMPPELRDGVAQGLAWVNGAWTAREYEFISPIGPAGAMSSTAADMARFMLAHLGGGSLDGRRILSAETAATMHETLFTNAGGLNGLAHGFMQYSLPGRYAAYGHGGATLHFMSNMVMIPELGLGIFVSTNSGDGREFVVSLPELIVGHYHGRPQEILEPPAGFSRRGQRYAGTYRTTRRSYTRLEKLFSLGEVISVSVTDDGYLVTSGGATSARWVEERPGVFREDGGPRVLAFGEDRRGRVTRVYDSWGITAAERIGFFGGMTWLALISALGLLTAVGTTTGAWLRRRRAIEQTSAERNAGRLMALLGAVWLLGFALIAATAVQLGGMGNDLLYDYPTPLLVVTLVALMAATALTAASVVTLYPVWVHGSWPLWRQLRHTAAVLVMGCLVLTLHSWNVIGLRYF